MMLSVMVMSTGAVTITDADDISPQYAEAAEVLTGMGIINGYEDDSFKPQQSITRAEVAAMIYRVATGDVDDEKADINAGAKLFTDVNADDWFAGYVNYCGDAEYIKGYEDDSFRADNDVTGYEVLAMILRAVGYDKNKEFTGPTWTINVASTATELGMLENLDNSVNLAEPATREVVAELIFRAIVPGVPTVNYVPAIGDYLPDTWGHSLGEQVFDLAVDYHTNDIWGRPSTTWYQDNTRFDRDFNEDKDVAYAVIEEEALAVYTTAVKECDVYEDTGVSGEVVTYTNGEVNKGTTDISKTAVKDTIGAQGRLTEVYEDEIVYIDTFLARVTGVTEVKYDADGHVAKDASLTLGVYANNGTNHNDAQSVTLTDDTNYTYAEGDMLLVNAVTAGAGWHDAIATDGDKHVEFVGAAESFVGAQTYIQWNDNQHTVDGDVYNDALHFHLDAAGLNGNINYNWYLDQYDNLIGVTAIDRTNYAVLKDMTWTSGQAEATLLYMNGEEATVTVNTIDGNSYGEEFEHFWSNRADDATPVMAASKTGFYGDEARISTDDIYNGIYDGFALYQVYTNDNGTVNLEGFEDNHNTDLIVDYANRATLDISASEIRDNGEVLAHVDASTRIVVNNGDGTYSTYTGTEELADIAFESAEIFWSVAEDGRNGVFTQNVYIKSYVPQADFGEHVFSTTATYGHIVRDVEGNTNYYVMNVYVDGVARNIVTNETVRDTLLANVGKLYEVKFDTMPIEVFSALKPNYDYGYVESVTLVNETTDGDLGIGFNCTCNYLANVDADDVGNNAIYDSMTTHSYNLTNATQVIYSNNTWDYSSLKEAVADGRGVWVVVDETAANNNAATIYVGEKLDTSTALTVTSAAKAQVSDAEFSADKATANIDVTYARGTNEDTLTYTANDPNSVIQVNTEEAVTGFGKTVASATDTVYGYPDPNPSRTVVVWNEAGTAHVTYYVVLDWYELSDVDDLATVYFGNNNTSLPNWHSTAAFAIADPVSVKLNDESTKITVTAKDPNATVEIGRGSDAALAEADLTKTNTIEVKDDTSLSGGYVLIKITAENGTVGYYAYQIGDNT